VEKQRRPELFHVRVIGVVNHWKSSADTKCLAERLVRALFASRPYRTTVHFS
jgi:hypothetical protein